MNLLDYDYEHRDSYCLDNASEHLLVHPVPVLEDHYDQKAQKVYIPNKEYRKSGMDGVILPNIEPGTGNYSEYLQEKNDKIAYNSGSDKPPVAFPFHMYRCPQIEYIKPQIGKQAHMKDEPENIDYDVGDLSDPVHGNVIQNI